jgi:iron(III) transport system substrate-binding protein
MEDPMPAVDRPLVIYAARANPSPAPLFNLYSELFDTPVVAEYGSIGPISDRLRAEAAAPRADVVITKTRFDMDVLRRDGVLSPTTAGAGLADWLVGADGHWVGFSGWPRLLIINRRQLPDAEQWPTSLEALTDPAWRGRFGCASILERTTRAHFAAIAADRGWGYLLDLLVRLRENGLRIFLGNTNGRIEMMADGLAGAVASASNVHLFHLEGHPVAPAWIDQGPGPDAHGTHVEAHSAALVAGGPQPDVAAHFMDWLLAAEAQSFLALRYGETPVNPAAEHHGVRPLSSIRRIDVSIEQLTAAMDQTLEALRGNGFWLPEEEAAARSGPA